MEPQKLQTTIHIPAPLRTYTGEHRSVAVEGATVGEAMADLATKYPALVPHLYDDQGRLRSFVNIFRNEEDVRYLDREATPLGPDDELSIVPSIAGGL
jgi:molybdopterin converting factor small subunit